MIDHKGPYVSDDSWAGHPAHDTTWTDYAECATLDPDLFTPEVLITGYHADRAERLAKQACERCGVARACLTYALTRGEPDGIWGGLTPQERGHNVSPADTPTQEAA